MFIRWGKPKYRIEVRLGNAGEWFWKVISTQNGQVLATSETYSNHDKCYDSAWNVANSAGWRVEQPFTP